MSDSATPTFRYRAILGLLLLWGGLLVPIGCSDPAMRTARFPITPDDELLSLPDLAHALGMKVLRSNDSLARLSDERRSVTIYRPPGGVYVNGRPLDDVEGVVVYESHLYVSRRVAKTIRATLQSSPPTPPPIAAPSTKSVVVLDAGHGGRDPGAVAQSGRREKDIVLAVAMLTAERLRAQGVRVVLTRATDVFVPLDDRAALANRTRPVLFVSIHADASKNRSARGPTVFVPRHDGKASSSHRAGEAIAAALANVASHSRGVRTHEKNLRVLETTTCPAVLVELGFLTHPAEVALLRQPSYQAKLAGALSEGILHFLSRR